MKNLIKTGLTLSFALFLMASCSKKKEEVKPEVSKEKAITFAEMQNKDNPQEEQGEMYYVFLMAISGYNGDIGNWDVGQLTDIGNWDVGQLAAFNGDIGNWDVGQLAENNDIGGWDVGQLGIAAMEFYGANDKDADDAASRSLTMQLEAMSDMNISDHNDCWIHPEWCKDFTNPVEMLRSSEGNLHDNTMNYIKAIRGSEAGVLGNDKMNQAEKDALLISYSIARYAAGFWYNQMKDSKPNGKFTPGIIQLSTLGASTAFVSADTKNVGIATAILNAYIAITQIQ